MFNDQPTNESSDCCDIFVARLAVVIGAELVKL